MIPYMSPELVTALMEIFAPKPVKSNRPPKKEKLMVAKTYHDHDADLSDSAEKPLPSSAMTHRATRTPST
jgi:hypothetical protein